MRSMTQLAKRLSKSCLICATVVALIGAHSGPQMTLTCAPSSNGGQVTGNSTGPDSVSLAWQIFDSNVVLVGSGSAGPVRVPPEYSKDIPVPATGGPFTVFVAASGSFNSAICETIVGGAKSAAARKSIKLNFDFGQIAQNPKNHWTVQVYLGAAAQDQVSVMYDAVYRDPKGLYHRLSGFPRNAGTHLIIPPKAFEDVVPVD